MLDALGIMDHLSPIYGYERASLGRNMMRRYAEAMRQLKGAGLRPTRQRLSILSMLLDTAPRHVTAEELFQEVRQAGIPVSLATIYNTLNQFTQAGLMGEVVVGSGQSYFDTDPSSHCHYFDKSTGEIYDIPGDVVTITHLPEPPPGKEIERIDVVVRIKNSKNGRGGTTLD